MHSTELTKNSSEEVDFISVILLIGGATFLAGLALYLIKKKKEKFFRDPPPIIVKTGSFIVERHKEFANELEEERKGSQYYYKSAEFGLIKTVIINKQGEDPRDCKDFYGLRVDIRLQQETSGGWSTVSDITTITTDENTRAFVLKINRQLEEDPTSTIDYDSRKNNIADQIRISNVIVWDHNNHMKYNSSIKNGENLALHFYNYDVD